MPISKDDWRLQGQERYFAGVTLVWSDWKQPAPDWEHDHCEFCWAKFAGQEVPNALHAGYATEDHTTGSVHSASPILANSLDGACLVPTVAARELRDKLAAGVIR